MHIGPPHSITISDKLDALQLEAALNQQIIISAEDLRVACKCAHCTRARFDERFPGSFPGIGITGFTRIGGYAINVAFSDGHDRGIYPWALLYSLGSQSSLPTGTSI